VFYAGEDYAAGIAAYSIYGRHEPYLSAGVDYTGDAFGGAFEGFEQCVSPDVRKEEGGCAAGAEESKACRGYHDQNRDLQQCVCDDAAV